MALSMDALICVAAILGTEVAMDTPTNTAFSGTPVSLEREPLTTTCGGLGECTMHRVRNILEIKEKLSGLPDLTEENEMSITSRDAVGMLADVLDTLISKGYSTQKIVQLLNENGMEIALSTLRRYMSQLKPATRKKQRKKKTTEKQVDETNERSAQPANAQATADAPKRTAAGFQVRKDSDEL